ncbi:alkaline phosphatase D family protein [Variovorax sp. VNK109]|uniref:alkaline phosphatase D family protein n=1 Tax=Variovorax sp. VNK109 TaxID=3400919 RepID=UPI003BFD264A
MNDNSKNSPDPVNRRRLLQLAAGSATLLWLPRSAWSQPRISSNPFALGVASGSPSPDGMVLWTRLVSGGFTGVSALSQGPVTVRWEVAHDEAFMRIAKSGVAQASPELAHSVHVEVQGLEPDRWYFYRFMVGGHGNDWVSPTGRTRTFPAEGAAVSRLRLAYASCQRWEHGYYAAYRHMRNESLDVVMFLGDYIYEYPGASEPARRVPGGWVITLDDYRARYALHKTDEDLQAMHAACPWLVTWDDHEVQNDYAGVAAGNAGPAVADFGARRAAAYQAYYEHMPLRSTVLTRAIAGLQQGAELRIYGRVPFGRLATLHLLDDRQYRNAQACTPEGRAGSGSVATERCAIWNDPARTLLGAEQETWLDRAFAESAGTTWNVVGQQSVFGRRDFRRGPEEFMWNDGWDGYTPARNRFLASMQKHSVANPVLLGGDVHENWVGHVKADYTRAESAALGVEFCGTSITSRTSVSPRQAEWLAENPHFVYANGEKRGYGVVEFTPRQITTTLRAVDDVTRRDSGLQTLAQFVVQAGRPQLERA